MEACQLCGLEKHQLCYHTKSCYLRDTAEDQLSSVMWQRVWELIAIEVKYYVLILQTLPDSELQKLQRPTLACLQALYDHR